MVKNETINSRVGLVISELGLSQAQFAEKTGIAKSNISQIVSGKRVCGPSIVNKIRFAFSIINIQWLKTGEGDMFLSQSATTSPSVNPHDVNAVQSHARIINNVYATRDEVLNNEMASESPPQRYEYNLESVSMQKIEQMLDQCQQMVARCNAAVQQATSLVNTASQIMTNAVALNNDMHENHRETRELYDKLHDVQQEHIKRSREWLEGSIVNIKNLRSEIFAKIDAQTKETETYSKANAKNIIDECRTISLDDLRQEIRTILVYPQDNVGAIAAIPKDDTPADWPSISKENKIGERA